MRDLIFACLLPQGEGEKDALRLARSIRTFAGQFSFNQIWMLSHRGEDELPESTRQELFSVGARLVSFEHDSQEPHFAFKDYVTAAGISEGLAQGETSILVLMSADTLVLQEPHLFMLPAGKSFGGCPVHLKLLGSAADEPVNDFWSLVYQRCHVEPERVFNVQTVVDEQTIRAYFNSGLLVVRPERGLLRGWQANFERLYQLPEFEPFYQQSKLYEIFMHQAVLAGTLLYSLKESEYHILPRQVNYPLHLHSQLSEKHRPAHISELITCRYEEYSETFSDLSVQNLIRADQPFYRWLQMQAN